MRESTKWWSFYFTLPRDTVLEMGFKGQGCTTSQISFLNISGIRKRLQGLLTNIRNCFFSQHQGIEKTKHVSTCSIAVFTINVAYQQMWGAIQKNNHIYKQKRSIIKFTQCKGGRVYGFFPYKDQINNWKQHFSKMRLKHKGIWGNPPILLKFL